LFILNKKEAFDKKQGMAHRDYVMRIQAWLAVASHIDTVFPANCKQDSGQVIAAINENSNSTQIDNVIKSSESIARENFACIFQSYLHEIAGSVIDGISVNIDSENSNDVPKMAQNHPFTRDIDFLTNSLNEKNAAIVVLKNLINKNQNNLDINRYEKILSLMNEEVDRMDKDIELLRGSGKEFANNKKKQINAAYAKLISSHSANAVRACIPRQVDMKKMLQYRMASLNWGITGLYATNALADEIPNFAYIYGVLNSYLQKPASVVNFRKYDAFGTSQASAFVELKQIYTFVENIEKRNNVKGNSVAILDFISKHPYSYSDDKYKILTMLIIQIILALAVAYQRINFSLNLVSDEFMDSIRVLTMDKPYKAVYRLRGDGGEVHVYEIYTKHIVVFTDTSMSSAYVPVKFYNNTTRIFSSCVEAEDSASYAPRIGRPAPERDLNMILLAIRNAGTKANYTSSYSGDYRLGVQWLTINKDSDDLSDMSSSSGPFDYLQAFQNGLETLEKSFKIGSWINILGNRVNVPVVSNFASYPFSYYITKSDQTKEFVRKFDWDPNLKKLNLVSCDRKNECKKFKPGFSTFSAVDNATYGRESIPRAVDVAGDEWKSYSERKKFVAERILEFINYTTTNLDAIKNNIIKSNEAKKQCVAFVEELTQLNKVEARFGPLVATSDRGGSMTVDNEILSQKLFELHNSL
jgi:hypothetical protein